MYNHLRAISSILIFNAVLIVVFLMVFHGYFGVLWRFIPNWPQALAILLPLATGTALNVIGLAKCKENKLGHSTERWLVRVGVFLLFWSILMSLSFAGGPKPSKVVYPLGYVIVGFGLAAGMILTVFSPLWAVWTMRRGDLKPPNDWLKKVKEKTVEVISSKRFILGTLLILWLMVPVDFAERELLKDVYLRFEPDAPTRFSPCFSGKQPSPLIGGYAATHYTEGRLEAYRASAVKLTVSFKGTREVFPATIQKDNYLGIGMAISGPDYLWGSRLSIDWAYSFMLFLNSSGGPYIQIEIWKVYEFFNLADKVVSTTYSNPQRLKLNSSVTLIMQWDDNGALNYYVSVDAEPLTPSLVYQYCPDVRNSLSPYFYLSPLRRMGQLPFTTSDELVKYFAFIGAWSAYSVSHYGWVTNLSFPTFIRTGHTTWENVTDAYSLNGANAFLDNNIPWGGTQYANINVDYHHNNQTVPPQQLRFYPTQSSFEFQENTLLWDSS